MITKLSEAWRALALAHFKRTRFRCDYWRGLCAAVEGLDATANIKYLMHERIEDEIARGGESHAWLYDSPAGWGYVPVAAIDRNARILGCLMLAEEAEDQEAEDQEAERAIVDAMNELAIQPDIAAFLEQRGIRGNRRQAGSCPVAQYLSHKTGAPCYVYDNYGFSLGAPVGRGRVGATRSRVKKFIDAFDDGAYPQLQA